MSDALQIPPEIEHVFGEKKPGSRTYIRVGTQEEYRIWTDAVFTLCAGGAVSPGGASMFGGISRASVHNRMEDNKLTAFIFEIQKGTKTGISEGRGMPYIYVPVSELKVWAEEIKQRGVKKGKITLAEVETSKSRWVQDFLAWKKKWQKKGGWNALWIF